MTRLRKPKSISDNKFKSAKRDELTSGRNFSKSDIPSLEMLCQWYAIVNQCNDDMTYSDGVQVVYQNDMGDIKALPQVNMLKQASAEIRAINKQLGINDQPQDKPKAKVTPLAVIQGNRAKRSAASSNSA
jgi:phage terminase small subunit